MIKYRFMERDYIFKKIQANSQYITTEDIESILSPSYIYDDITICLIPYGQSTAFKTVLIDNTTDQDLPLSELSGFALEYYYKVVKDYSLQRQRELVSDGLRKMKETNKISKLVAIAL